MAGGNTFCQDYAVAKEQLDNDLKTAKRKCMRKTHAAHVYCCAFTPTKNIVAFEKNETVQQTTRMVSEAKASFVSVTQQHYFLVLVFKAPGRRSRNVTILIIESYKQF